MLVKYISENRIERPPLNTANVSNYRCSDPEVLAADGYDRELTVEPYPDDGGSYKPLYALNGEDGVIQGWVPYERPVSDLDALISLLVDSEVITLAQLEAKKLVAIPPKGQVG